MAFESFKAQLSMLINDSSNQPQDMAELYEILHLKLMELRNTGQPVPDDLLQVERLMQEQLGHRKS